MACINHAVRVVKKGSTALRIKTLLPSKGYCLRIPLALTPRHGWNIYEYFLKSQFVIYLIFLFCLQRHVVHYLALKAAQST